MPESGRQSRYRVLPALNFPGLGSFAVSMSFAVSTPANPSALSCLLASMAPSVVPCSATLL